MRILVIDNNIMPECWGAPDLRRYATRAPGASVHARRAPHDDLPSEVGAFDKVVISGSLTSVLEKAPWIDHLDQAVRRLLDLGKPILGVCYGHQVLARVLGGAKSVRRGNSPEFGWTKIEKISQAPLLDGLPETFYSFSAHYDEVCELPAGAKHLARSERCPIQAMQIGDRPVYGIQFHPEKSFEEGHKSLQERVARKKPEPLLHFKDGRKFFDESVGDKIFENFLKQ